MYSSDLESKLLNFTKEQQNANRLVKQIERGGIKNIIEARAMLNELAGHYKSKVVECEEQKKLNDFKLGIIEQKDNEIMAEKDKFDQLCSVLQFYKDLLLTLGTELGVFEGDIAQDIKNKFHDLKTKTSKSDETGSYMKNAKKLEQEQEFKDVIEET